MRQQGQEVGDVVHRLLSILYLRCTARLRHVKPVPAKTLSILYLRCIEKKLERIKIVTEAFNSLFEMPLAGRTRRLTRRRLLSILYLRCRQRRSAGRTWPRASFNSLFEMQGLVSHMRLASSQRSAFNSLFEMPIHQRRDYAPSQLDSGDGFQFSI